MKTKNILVVDDEPDMGFLLTSKYKNKITLGEYKFTFASSGQEALDMIGFGENKFDLILLDISMTIMNGYTFMKKINEAGIKVKVIVLSAYSDQQNIRAMMNLGVFDFISKPIDFNDLDITINRAFNSGPEVHFVTQLNEKQAGDILTVVNNMFGGTLRVHNIEKLKQDFLNLKF